MKSSFWKAPLLAALGAAQCLLATNVEVRIENFAFVPADVTVNVGDSVTWRQVDSISHTATSSSGAWDSGFLSPNQTFSHTFAAAGTFGYFCRPHPFMTGRVTVQAAQAQPPTVSITSPTNNSTLPPGPVTIAADASAPGSSIVHVEFFDGTAFLGMDMDAPYSFNATLGTGPHVLTAKVTAANDLSATSAAVNVTVGAPPTPIENPYPPIVKTDLTIELEVVAEGLVSPLGLAASVDGRLFVYDQAGLIQVIANGTKLPEPALDVRSRLVTLNPNYDERGLLGLALHPNFAQNGLLYTYTSEPNGGTADFMIMGAVTNDHQNVVAEWKMDAASTNRVDPNSRREIMRIDQPQGNHNAGTMHFGADGLLYVALGDGGNADDEGNGHSPQGNGQDLNSILGKLIRIDVSARTSANGQYGVPSDNPFVGRDGLDEIYAYGFRNPYTWSFDRLTGEMYVADVGQNQIEELNRVFKGGNYGWRIKEGTFFFDTVSLTNAGIIVSNAVVSVPAGLVDPIAEYDHSEGTAIVGGYVYRGSRIPGLLGKHVSGDFGQFGSPAGRLFVLERNEFRELRIGLDNRALGLWLKGFGQDAEGELYVMASSSLGPAGSGGRVLKIVPPTNSLSIAITRQNTNASISIENGVGPFVLQGQGATGEEMFHTLTATGQRTAVTALMGPGAVIRTADAAGNGSLGFTVSLSGAAERPNPVTTTATGSGNLSLDGNTLHFDIRYSGLSGPATAAHIHGRAKASAAAGVLIDLGPFKGSGFGASGTLAGSVVLNADQKAAILSGETYVNVHTAANGGGEIRGQIAPLAFMASLSGAAERPNKVSTAGRGNATMLLVGNQLMIAVDYSGLSGAATAAHIHGPANSEASIGVMVNLAPFNGGSFGAQGTMRGTITLTPDQLSALVDGLTYVNIHTGANPGGEIRGQIRPMTTAVAMSAVLSGTAERPNPVSTPGTGSGYFALEGSTLHFNVQYTGLKAAATAAHIHGPAGVEQAAGVLIDLRPFNGGAFGANGILAGKVVLTEQQRAWVLQGRTYVNIHTSEHGGGEIRGQIAAAVMHAELLGASERANSVLTAGKGRATLILAGDQLSIQASYSGLSGAATAAHIHGPGDTASAAGVLKNLADLNGGAFGVSGSFSGTVGLDAAQLGALIDGRTYLNIHTAGNPGGEIRGQIIR